MREKGLSEVGTGVPGLTGKEEKRTCNRAEREGVEKECQCDCPTWPRKTHVVEKKRGPLKERWKRVGKCDMMNFGTSDMLRERLLD